MSGICNPGFYQTRYNKGYQTLYCERAQQVDTDLSKAVTSGVSFAKAASAPRVVEGYCLCNSVLVNTPMMLKYKEEKNKLM